MRDAQLCAQGTALCACGAPPLLHVPGGGGCVSGTGSSTLCGVTRTLSASCDSRRCVPLSVSRSQCIQWRGGSVVRSNVWLSRSSTRRRGTGQAHAARQETTTRRALRDLGARRPSRAFSRGGGKNENHSEGRMRGWHGGRRRACFRDTRYQEERAQSKVDDFMYQNSAFVHIVHILHICYILHFRHIMHILHINILAYFAYFAYFAYSWFVLCCADTFCARRSLSMDFGTISWFIVQLASIYRRSFPNWFPRLTLKWMRSWTASSACMLCIFCIFCIFDIFCIFLFCVCVRLKKNMGQSMGLEGRALVPLQSFQPLVSCWCSVIKLELCACACEPALGNSLAFCWDHIKASTRDQTTGHIFLHIICIFCILCILQYAEYAKSEHGTILHIVFGVCILFCILWNIYAE